MMPQISVGDLLTRSFCVVDTEDTLSYCQGILRERHLRALVVLDKRKKYSGMLSEKDFVRSLVDPSKTKVKSVFRKTPRLSPSQSLGEAARLMVENDLKYLPVFEREKVVGLVTDDSLLKTVAGTPYGSRKVEELMTREPVTVPAEDSIGRAVSMMREEGISRLPVIRDGKPVGIVTLHDILDEVYGPRDRMTGKVEGRGQMVKPLKDPVSSIMSSPLVTAFPGDPTRSAIGAMMGRDISSLVVVGENGRLVGLVTKTDLLRPLAEAAVVRPSVKLEISVKDPDGVEELDRERLASMLAAFARKHEKMLTDSIISLYIKSRRSQKKGPRLVHCRVMASGPSGQFSAVGEGWSASVAIREALDNLERRIIKAKEMSSSNAYSERLLSEALGLLG
jgi:CBS domain-containing protein/ribosome-associated translation inhibitor RaiA